jgi:hypothetical protein
VRGFVPKEKTDALHETDELLPKTAYDERWMHRYEVSAAKGVIGVMGFKHPRRWTMASEECGSSDGMMDHLNNRTEYVESAGIEMAIMRVNGVDDDDDDLE